MSKKISNAFRDLSLPTLHRVLLVWLRRGEVLFMGTPIENVRGLLNHVAAKGTKPVEMCFHQDLAAVLADAERYKALEKAHGSSDTSEAWSYVDEDSGKRRFFTEPLSELADRLRKETT